MCNNKRVDKQLKTGLFESLDFFCVFVCGGAFIGQVVLAIISRFPLNDIAPYHRPPNLLIRTNDLTFYNNNVYSTTVKETSTFLCYLYNLRNEIIPKVQ